MKTTGTVSIIVWIQTEAIAAHAGKDMPWPMTVISVNSSVSSSSKMAYVCVTCHKT